MSYNVDGGVVTLEELFDQKVVDFIGQYYKEDLADPLNLWLSILAENAAPYANSKDIQFLEGKDGKKHETAMPYVLDLQYGIGAKKLYDALEKAKGKLDKKIEEASNANMKGAFEHEKLALIETLGAYVDNAKKVGKFHALKYKAAMEFYKNQIIKEADEQKKADIKPIDDRIAAADGILKSI